MKALLDNRPKAKPMPSLDELREQSDEDLQGVAKQ